MKPVHLLFTLIVSAMLVGACANDLDQTPPNKGLRVLATESFLGDITQNVAGDRIRIDTLMPVTADPHEYQPTTGDIIKIANSQVLIVNGLGYETWLKKTLDNTGGNRLEIIASKGLQPDPDPSGEHVDGDPHMWMDPLNVVRYVENIRDGLAQADPSGKAVYAKNADDYIKKLKELDSWIKEQVAQLPPGKRLLVTNHDALGYFANAYGLTVVGAIIPSVSTEAAPSAQQMANLIDTIRSKGATVIFLDSGENKNLAQQIAAETGVKVVTDLYVETISSPDGPAPTYIEMLKYDVNQILSALK